MRALLFLITFLSGIFTTCSQSSKPSLSTEKPSFTHQGDAFFKFTNRGVEYDAHSTGKEDPRNNLATLQYDPVNGNRLDISAFDANTAPDQSFRTGLAIVIYLGDQEMKKGSYRFAADKELIPCKERNMAGCGPLANGAIVPYTPHGSDGYHDSEYTLENALHAVSGEIQITEFTLNNFSLGMAEGRISGQFFFDGYAMESRQTHPGSASGKFENVKVVAQQRK